MNNAAPSDLILSSYHNLPDSSSLVSMKGGLPLLQYVNCLNRCWELYETNEIEFKLDLLISQHTCHVQGEGFKNILDYDSDIFRTSVPYGDFVNFRPNSLPRYSIKIHINNVVLNSSTCGDKCAGNFANSPIH